MFKHLLSSDTVEIDAPVQRAWDILMDVERYGEWNPFTPRVATDFEIGSRVDLSAMIGPVPLKQVERIEVVDPPHRLVWTTTIGHRFLLFARREQLLETAGETRCRYRTTDAFSGLFTPLVVLFFGGMVRRGFNSVAGGLKARAEAGWQPVARAPLR